MTKPPRISQRVVRPPSVEAVRQIVVVAEDRDPRLAPLLMLAALTGMLRGERCVLRWSDLDPESGEIDTNAGVTTHSLSEAAVKRAAAKTSRRVIAVADSSKLDKVAFGHVCDLAELDVVVTDAAAAERIVDELIVAGVDVRQV